MSVKKNSIFEEIEQYRPKTKRTGLSKEQMEFIIKCRDHERPVTYATIAKLFDKAGWGNISASTIRNYYNKAKNV